MSADEQNQVLVRLAEQQDALWRRFATHTNEMVVTKTGRRIFPLLEYHIEGLDADKMYAMFVEIHQVDDNRYKFSEGKWMVAGNGEITSAKANTNLKKTWHPDGVRTGKQWMASEVYFDNVKVTNNSKSKEIFVYSMHKYVPVLSIYESASEFLVPQHLSKPVATIRIEHTEFIAVTSYQNQSITSLKIATNPSAKRFRDDSIKSPTKSQRRQSSSPSPPPPPPPKRAKFDVESLMLPAIVPPSQFMPPPTYTTYSPFLLQTVAPYFYNFGAFNNSSFTGTEQNIDLTPY